MRLFSYLSINPDYCQTTFQHIHIVNQNLKKILLTL